MKPNPEWTADQKVEAVRTTALALSATWEQLRDAKREGRNCSKELERARALADDLAALSNAAIVEIGRCASKTSG